MFPFGTFLRAAHNASSFVLGLQKLDGLEGNLIIRSPKDYDPNGNLYDFDLPEHKLFISDWLHLPADDHFPGLLRADSGQDANSFLINGKGRTLVRAYFCHTTCPVHRTLSDSISSYYCDFCVNYEDALVWHQQFLNQFN